VTEQAMAQLFAHRIKGKVTRWRLPGIGGFNFLLREALGGGGMASIKADPLAKAFAQMLLDMPVRVPASLAQKLTALRLKAHHSSRPSEPPCGIGGNRGPCILESGNPGNPGNSSWPSSQRERQTAEVPPAQDPKAPCPYSALRSVRRLEPDLYFFTRMLRRTRENYRSIDIMYQSI
jgi:hypothetical protein